MSDNDRLTDDQLAGRILELERDINRMQGKLGTLNKELRDLRRQREHRETQRLLHTSDPMKSFRQLWDELDEVMGKYGKFGASDSEPRYHRFRACEKALVDGKVEVPTSARGWEMFSGMKGAGQAAKEVSQACRKLCKLLTQLPRKEAQAAARWIGVDL